MIDINYTTLVQLANFIVLLLALNFILFRPIRQVMQERHQLVSGAFSDAKAAQDRMQSLLEQYNVLLTEAKQKSTAVYNTIYQQGLDAQRDMIAAERAKAGELMDKARAEIASASGIARADLKQEAGRLSKDIATKLLGRAV